jgi:hypothetical protein
MNIGMDQTVSPSPSLSPEKRRRKVPDKFREHITPELSPHQQDVSSFAPTEPEASAEKVAYNEKKNAVGTVVKKRRGRPRKVRPGESALDSEESPGFQLPAPRNPVVHPELIMFRYGCLLGSNFADWTRQLLFSGLFDVLDSRPLHLCKIGLNLFFKQTT